MKKQLASMNQANREMLKQSINKSIAMKEVESEVLEDPPTDRDAQPLLDDQTINKT